MAFEEHVKILHEGVDAWNHWRKEHSDLQPGLMGADFRGMDLRGADFHWSNLSGANLKGANLSNADLRLADLGQVILDDTTQMDAKWHRVWEVVNQRVNNLDFSGADLSWAYLVGLDFGGANVCGANLSHADLRWTDLRGVILDDATQMDAKWHRVWEVVNQRVNNLDFSGADLSWAYLCDVDLRSTDLHMAHLTGAKLRGTDLRNSNHPRGPS